MAQLVLKNILAGSGNVLAGGDNSGNVNKVTIGSNLTLSGGVLSATGGGTGSVTSVAITESGDSLVITGSPITTSGTINIGFAGTGAQYIKGDGTLATFPTTIDQARKLVTEVYNSTGATLTKGTVVYINGGQGNLPTVTKAIATGDSTSAQTYGVVQADITNMNNGYVVVFGSLNDIDTQAYAVGAQLYLSGTTAGAWTSTKPSAPIHLVYVGIVVRSHPTQGIVEIRIQNGYELDELHDVQITSLADGDILKYDLATDLWKNVAGTTTNIAEGTNLYFTNARARAVLSTNIGSALTYNSSTGRFTLNAASSSTDGYVTAADFNYWDAKQESIGTGTTTQYLRGDLTWETVPPPALSDLSDVVITSPTNGQLLRYTLTGWKNFTPTYVAAGFFSAIAPLSYDSGTGVFAITQANTTTNGYLSSIDWNTFNNKQPFITAGTTSQYYRGDKTFQTLNTDVVTEGTTNLYFTNTRARGVLSTNIGSALTYNSSTGRFTLNAAATGVDGYITGADYDYWNAKQASLGTGTTSQFLRGDLTWETVPPGALDDLTDVTITSPSNGQLLRYTVGGWINFTPTYLTANQPITVTATGEATGTSTSSATAPSIALTLTNSAVIGKVLTGLNITGGSVSATDSILTAFGKVQNQINGLIGGSIYKGTWNASTNTPALTSSVGTAGWYYIVSVAGTTNLNGITDWQLGDWAIFNGGVWQKVDNTDSVVSVNGFTGAVSLTTDNISEGSTNLYYTNTRARLAFSANPGSALTYNNTTGRYTLNAADGTIEGYVTNADYAYWDAKQQSLGTGTTSQYLRGDLTWSNPPAPALEDLTDVTITSPSNGQLLRYTLSGWVNFTPTYVAAGFFSATAPLSYNSTTGVFSISQATTSTNGYLSSTDWNTFNNKASTASLANYLPLTGGTLTGALNGTSATFSSTVQANAKVFIQRASAGADTLLQFKNEIGTDRAYINFSGTTEELGFYAGSGSTRNMVIGSDGAMGFNYSTLASRSFVFKGLSGRSLVIEAVETAGIQSLYLRPSASVRHLISSNYLSGSTYLPLSLSGRENDTDFVLNTNGNVGIGTSSPSGELHVKAASGFAELYVQGAGSTSGMYLFDNGTESGLWKIDSGYMAFATNNTERLRITSDGKLKLTSTSAGGTNLDMYLLENDGLYLNSNEGATARAIYFQTGGTTKATITSAGNVGINLTPYSGSALEVKGLSASSIVFQVRASDGNNSIYISPNNGGYNRISGNYMTSAPYLPLSITARENNSDLVLLANGNILIGTTTDTGYKLEVNGQVRATAFFESSDKRLKKELNANPIVNGISNIKPKLYIKDGKEELGYYAQELEQILPSSVSEGKDGFLSLSYTQVHTAKIAELENKIEQLEKLIKNLI